MPRPSEPAMNDPADKDIHQADSVKPYPAPAKSDVVGKPEGDVEDPAKVDADAPHDRGKAKDGSYTTGTDAMKEQLDAEGVREAWKKGKTQDTPPAKR